MKAVVVAKHGVVEIREIAAPAGPGLREAMVKIEACGLCGTTDRHLVDGHQPHHAADQYPAVLGHEAVGVVTAVGPGVTRFKEGDRVTRPCAIWPGTTRDGLFSAWGGFAEFGVVREPAPGEGDDYMTGRQKVVPAGLSVEDAVLAISVAEVAGWMGKVVERDASGLRGKTVLIGGAGFAACVMAQRARAAGAARVIAAVRSERRAEAARRNGCTDTVEMGEGFRDAVRALTGGAGVDWFLDAAGHQVVFEAGLGVLRGGGSAAIYGAPDGFAYRLPLGAVGGDFAVHYLAPPDDEFLPEACRLLASGEVSGAWLRSHVWQGLESLPEALRAQAAGEVLKGVVRIA